MWTMCQGNWGIKSTIILVLIGTLLLCSCGIQEKWHTSTFFFFDTLCEVKLLSTKDLFRTAEEDIRRIFSEIDSLFSPGAGASSSPKVVELFRQAAEVHWASDGCFDITVAPLSRIWGFLDCVQRVPEQALIDEALQKVGMEGVKLEPASISLPPGVELDWGGIAKGYGIDLASRALQERGIEQGFINAGGDLFCWGKNPEGKPWKIGIKHPRQAGYLGILEISCMGAATAGDYQRFFLADGIRYHHIFDPKTGYPARGKQSVTVVGPEALKCDALSTALFVSSQPEYILSKYPEYGAVIMDSEGRITLLGKKASFHPSR